MANAEGGEQHKKINMQYQAEEAKWHVEMRELKKQIESDEEYKNKLVNAS